jgi:UDP-N-acetylglucosamine/UDP-N-acetylgalactosamine diphosphorylase
MPHDLPTLRARLDRVGQSHLLNFYDKLAPGEQQNLLAQVAAIDLEALPKLVDEYVKHKPTFALPPDVAPAPYYPYEAAAAKSEASGQNTGKRNYNPSVFARAGEDLLRAGKVAAFVVAGGQGSRLGFEGPKGCFPAGAVTNKTLFQLFAEQLLAASRTYGKPVPWYIMTSPLNHDATVAFFKEHSFFGLNAGDVRFFQQGVLPSLDITTGKVLLAAPGEVATNPDGHGGAIKALHVSGSLADMRRRGVEHLSYFQVDNPHVKILDPVFLGLHATAPDSSGEMSSKMIPKAYAEEKLGVFCLTGASTGKPKVEVIEYSDLPIALSKETLPDGSLRFNAGSIAIHALGVAFLEKLNTDAAFALPYHRAEKKIPCVDAGTGAKVTPTANNGVKLERFVFDALALCRASIVYETDRLEEFAPIKNATGVDSVESSKQLQTQRAAKWLEACGVKIPRKPDGTPDCVLEISPLTATSAQQLAPKAKGLKISPGDRLAI